MLQILELGVLSNLLKMVKSNCVEEASKALYAVSALIRSNLTSQELFYAEAGNLMLQVTYFYFLLLLQGNSFTESIIDTNSF